jgi:hypothetical protein
MPSVRIWFRKQIRVDHMCREPWLVISPRNRAAVIEAAGRLLREITPRLALERFLGGRQS